MTKKAMVTSEPSPEDSSLTDIGDTELDIMGSKVERETSAEPNKNTLIQQVDTSVEDTEEQTNHRTRRTPGYIASDEEGYEMSAPHDNRAQVGKRNRTPVNYSDTGRARTRTSTQATTPKGGVKGTRKKPFEKPKTVPKKTKPAKKPAANGDPDSDSDFDDDSRPTMTTAELR